MAYVQYLNPLTRQVKTVPLVQESVVFGRHPLCEIVLNGGAISREHARIVHNSVNDIFYLEDLQSRNGTVLNDIPINEKMRLYDGDTIRISDLCITFHSSNPVDKRQNIQKVEQSDGESMIIDDGVDESRVNITQKISMSSDLENTGNKVLQKLDLENEVQNLQTRLRVMIEMGKTLGKISDSRELLPRFLSLLLILYPAASSVCLIAPNEETKQLELRAYKRKSDAVKEPFRVSRSIYENVVSNKTGILSEDLINDSRFGPNSNAIAAHAGSFMAVPIIDQLNDTVNYVLQIETAPGKRPFCKNDLELLVTVSNLATLYHENLKMQETRVQEKMSSQEMNVAHKVQQGFLPNESPKLPNYMFYDYYHPAKFIGGDYFDYIPLSDDRLAIVVGDVAGKGISAALLMAKLSAEVRHSLIMEKSFPEAMTRINNVYAGNHFQNWFITFLLAVIDTKTNSIHIMNAGHVLPILSHTDGTVEDLAEPVTAFPLGVMPDTEYREYVFAMKKGESLALMSDGLTDAVNSKGEYFTIENVKNYLRNDASLNPAELGQRLICAVRDFVGDTTQSDDQCLVVFGRTS